MNNFGYEIQQSIKNLDLDMDLVNNIDQLQIREESSNDEQGFQLDDDSGELF